MNTADQGVPLDADSCDDLDCESQGCTGACERFTEAELIAADLEYGCNKSAKAHEAQEPNLITLAEKCSAEVGRHEGEVVWVKFHSRSAVEAFATGIVMSAAVRSHAAPSQPVAAEGVTLSTAPQFNRDSFDVSAFFAAVHGAMAYRKVNAKQLSEATGISETTLSRMWAGTRTCDAASLAALSAWAGINPANYCRAAPSQFVVAEAAWRCIKPHCPTNCDSCNHAIRNEPGARLLIVELLDTFANDGHGATFEDGDCAIVDKARAFVCMPEVKEPLPPSALAAARAFGAGLDGDSLEQPSEVL